MGIPINNGSAPMSISPSQRIQWVKNALVFLAPLGILYITPIIGTLSGAHVISLQDFVPSSFTVGAIALYVLNTIYDFLRKFVPNTQ